ncbi:hypothetical protein LSH36_137g02030 [Paralvinella palmiformis]|uniref:INO80 complex subunit F domain-containing protein n=1 Tax=Paralvinella palmiformis TaxID=53620 RepID=A0AAD9JXE4_9ANNE|nr:hypothetical protein LSH36_137g02030 [Paralvinella palmiformis]
MTSEVDLYQRKYSLLKRKCEELHQTNEKLVNRIHQVKRILKRYKCERRMLVEELDKHGDDFREAEIPPMYEVAGGCESQDIEDASGILNSSLQLSDQA